MLQQGNFHPEQLASEWSERIGKRMQEIGVPTAEVEETKAIILAFTRTAAQELVKEPKISLPYTQELFEINPDQGHQIIELFLRGVNHTSKKLRDTGRSWDDRKDIMEQMAWKLFNLSKLLVAFLYIPNPALANILNTQKDLQLMMKQSADVLMDEHLSGRKGGMPFSF